MNKLQLIGWLLLLTLAACGSDDTSTVEKSTAKAEMAGGQANGITAGDAEAARQTEANRIQESINNAY